MTAEIAGASFVHRKLAGPVAIGAGGFLDLAFPGVGWWPVVLVAVGIFLMILPGRHVGIGALLRLLFGMGFFVPHVAWSGIYVGAMPWLA